MGYNYRWFTLPRHWFRAVRTGWFRGWNVCPDLVWIAAQESLRRMHGDYKGMRRVRGLFGIHYYTKVW